MSAVNLARVSFRILLSNASYIYISRKNIWNKYHTGKCVQILKSRLLDSRESPTYEYALIEERM